jgi:hypothetical protein
LLFRLDQVERGLDLVRRRLEMVVELLEGLLIGGLILRRTLRRGRLVLDVNRDRGRGWRLE